MAELKDEHESHRMGMHTEQLAGRTQQVFFTPEEEERKVRQIKDLAQSRATVKNYHDRLEKMQEDDRMREGLARRVAGAEERLEGLRSDIAREKGRCRSCTRAGTTTARRSRR